MNKKVFSLSALSIVLAFISGCLIYDNYKYKQMLDATEDVMNDYEKAMQEYKTEIDKQNKKITKQDKMITKLYKQLDSLSKKE